MADQRTAGEILTAFQDYVGKLDKIPVNADGNPNLSLMARACNFDRKRFATNPALAATLSQAIKEKGLAESPSINRTDQALSKAKSEIKRLKEQLEVLKAELREKDRLIGELEAGVANTEITDVANRAAQVFLTTGRMPR